MADILISFFLMLFGAGALVIIAFCLVYVLEILQGKRHE